jgi:ribonuclease HI
MKFLEVVRRNLKAGPTAMARSRTEEIKRWMHLAESFKDAEHDLKNSLSERRRYILADKRLVLLKTLLQDAGHSETTLVDDLTRGFDLTGTLPESNSFAKKVRPATMSCEELRRVADMCRQGMLETTATSGDSTLDEQLYAATLKELNKGFLEGPIDPAALPEGATLTRRFGVRQKSKTRPIDDYKSSFVNSSVVQSETASVHTIDHIASMIACLMREASSLGVKLDLSAKAWDLADAYKQVPLSEEAYMLDSFLVVYAPETKGPEIYRQKVLPFGSVASVTAFLRISLAVWKLGVSLLSLVWSSYFDDFFSITDTASSRHSELVISSLFRILGWRLSQDKLIAYDTICKVLGVKFDFTQSGAGLVHVFNTEDRVSELCEQLAEVLQAERLRRGDGERLRGRLLFAAGQLFGRGVRNQVRVLSKHLQSGRINLSPETAYALLSMKHHLANNVPRAIVGSLSDHIHIYVDASFSDGSYSGLGGAVYDSRGKPKFFFSEEVSPSLLSDIRDADQITVIQELEMLALLVAVSLWCPVFRSHRVVAFSDSEAVRGSFLKTWSLNESSNHLLAQIFRVEESSLCQIWLERVPSQSNPVDSLSREKTDSWMGLKKQEINCHAIWSESAKSRGKSATDELRILPQS